MIGRSSGAIACTSVSPPLFHVTSRKPALAVEASSDNDLGSVTSKVGALIVGIMCAIRSRVGAVIRAIAAIGTGFVGGNDTAD